MIGDLKPYAEYRESELTWLNCRDRFVGKRSQDHREIAGVPANYGRTAA
jgi:hypothetical protein